MSVFVFLKVLGQIKHLLAVAASELFFAIVFVVVAVQAEFCFENTVACVHVALEHLLNRLFQNLASYYYVLNI